MDETTTIAVGSTLRMRRSIVEIEWNVDSIAAVARVRRGPTPKSNHNIAQTRSFTVEIQYTGSETHSYKGESRFSDLNDWSSRLGIQCAVVEIDSAVDEFEWDEPRSGWSVVKLIGTDTKTSGRKTKSTFPIRRPAA